jgi:hypothetical protein
LTLCITAFSFDEISSEETNAKDIATSPSMHKLIHETLNLHLILCNACNVLFGHSYIIARFRNGATKKAAPSHKENGAAQWHAGDYLMLQWE